MRYLPALGSIVVLLMVALTASPQDPPVQRAVLFDLPMKRLEKLRLQQILYVQFTQKQFHAAEQIASQLTVLEPDDPAGWYNLACVQAVTGQTQSALTSLKQAVEKGFRDLKRLESDADLASLRSDARFEEIQAIAKTPFVPVASAIPFEPGRIQNQTALVTERNTQWSDERMSLISSFELPPAPVLTQDQIKGSSAAEVLVNTWIREGTAAGHHGDLYDNRDRDHSNLKLRKFPMLVHVEYSPEASKAEADWGMRIGQAFELPTFGNSSTAQVNSPFWRSNPRMLMHQDLLMKMAWNQFVNNQLYCYPEHNDFDQKHGDVYPANTPYWVISQGSSGSDQPFLEAIALTLAAFQPEVKKTLIEKRLLMPVIQLLLRRSQSSVVTDEDYLSGKGHPVVFQSAQLDPLRMVQMAHELTIDTIPPLVRLKVVQETLGLPGKDYFHPMPAEKLFDTPAAISRIYRTTAHERKMIVDASDSIEIAGRSLTFRWVVLQGNPDQVRIRTLNKAGSQAEVVINWHERAAIPGLPGMSSNRVDIGVFAISETAMSLPGFVSSMTLANEKRIYNENHQIQSIDYSDPVISRMYVDPYIDIPKSWRDDYHYDAANTLTGWTRTFANEPPQEFAADGRLIVQRNDKGMPVEWKQVRYEASLKPDGTSILKSVVVE